MSPLTRLLTFSVVVLLVLITVTLGAQAWLRQQEVHILRSAKADLAEQLQAGITLTGGVDATWDEARLTRLSQVTGTSLSVLDRPPPAADDELGPFQFFQELPGERWLVAAHPAPAGTRIHRLLQRVVLALGVFALLIMAALVVTVGMRPLRDRETRSPFAARERDMRSLSLLARTSLRQQAELDQERDERIRAEADARHRLQLLNRALEEKIRIGRDLHDGVIQSLYAAGLTLQAAQQLSTTDSAQAGTRLQSALELINRTIADIRSYIAGLSPRQVRRESLHQALTEIVEELRAGRPLELECQIDERVSTALSDDQLTETTQIVREAVSNALRHGGAQKLWLALNAVDTGAELSLRDDGIGFDLNQQNSPRGHGLANMQARAERAGGSFEMVSSLGGGTAIRVSWPTVNAS
ncbi:sensor histidine kinase [Actomonas aquatica]|uniref:histidine kinase n=1 Tax=Actomonas aquatica TaxID=2866162 RepID=A0ABZ1C966_9BACT|nr:sensor histidine kinase [Opitutus sp. WL0086]WRQ88180.1 sensor histidine kinase [Opitutus sp. WL0086]